MIWENLTFLKPEGISYFILIQILINFCIYLNFIYLVI